MESVGAQERWKGDRAQPEVSVNGKTLEMPWAGGLNACHFAAIDLNGDGKDDYIAFDRIGNRTLCFSSGWQLLPEMENRLPALQYWVQSHDFDGDGRKDLFTFNGISGICVYRNVSGNTPDGFNLQFERYTKGLPAEMFGTSSPLYCTWADYPVIEDIDGDGDLDVLNFWVPSTGDFLLYYRNLAMEECQRKDTFLLRVDDWSWGCFVENEESNAIFLDSCSFRNVFLPKRGKNASKHAGSTLFAVNNPKSGLFDIVLGDVGYPGLLFLHNGGTPEKAHITSYDTVFPLSQPARLYNFPVLSQVLYKDSLCYVLSPFETDPFNAQGSQSLWRYRDTGNGAAFAPLVQKNFLQEEMLDFGVGAVAVSFDYNHDGKMDLVVGNYGNLTESVYEGGSWRTIQTSSLSLLENTGTAEQPAFELRTNDYLELSKYGHCALYPAFADLDGDGLEEMVLGMEDGRLWLFRLQEDALQAVLLDSLFLGETFSGFSAPTLFDLNQDGLPDLIVGEKQHTWPAPPRRITKGSLTFFQNMGRKENVKTGGLPRFEKITDSLGGVDVIDRNFSNFGYSRPSFYRNAQGEITLACGGENGEVYMYDRISGHLQDNFRYLGRAATLSESQGETTIRCGIHAAPLLYDFDGDGLPELIVGNQCGGFQYFDGKSLSVAADDVADEKPVGVEEKKLSVYPNPARNGFYVQLLRKGCYLLLDLNGTLLERFRWQEGLHYVDISRLPSGIYVLQEENSCSFPQKIIKP